MEKIPLVARAREGAARAARSLALILVCVSSGCLVQGNGGVPALNVTSAAFTLGGEIPVVYTCDGANISPPLTWDAPPGGTKSMAILVTDSDAPGETFVHWAAYNIPPGTREIPAGAWGEKVLPAGSLEGMNDFGRPGYGGPCPPRGKPHHYHFTVYALDTTLNPGGKVDGRMLEAALAGHVLSRGEIVGIYGRR